MVPAFCFLYLYSTDVPDHILPHAFPTHEVPKSFYKPVDLFRKLALFIVFQRQHNVDHLERFFLAQFVHGIENRFRSFSRQRPTAIRTQPVPAK